MATRISKGLKWTFFIHFIVAQFFGFVFFMLVQFLFIERAFIRLEIIGWGDSDPITLQLFGFTFMAFALSSFIAWKETEWEKVKTIVIMEIAWFMGGVFVMFWSLYFGVIGLSPELPPMGWIYLIIFCAFLIAFIVFYIKHEQIRKSTTSIESNQIIVENP